MRKIFATIIFVCLIICTYTFPQKDDSNERDVKKVASDKASELESESDESSNSFSDSSDSFEASGEGGKTHVEGHDHTGSGESNEHIHIYRGKTHGKFIHTMLTPTGGSKKEHKEVKIDPSQGHGYEQVAQAHKHSTEQVAQVPKHSHEQIGQVYKHHPEQVAHEEDSKHGSGKFVEVKKGTLPTAAAVETKVTTDHKTSQTEDKMVHKAVEFKETTREKTTAAQQVTLQNSTETELKATTLTTHTIGDVQLPPTTSKSTGKHQPDVMKE